MKYCVIGSGGREHAITWKLLNDGSAREVYVIPGNGGVEERYRVSIEIDDFAGIGKFCAEQKIDMVVVGPEAPLVGGLVDYLEKQKIPVFGPVGRAAMLEGSKLFAKQIMVKYGVPTSGHREFSGKRELMNYVETADTYPMVIKLDGLAAGKGVGIPHSKAEALRFIDEMVKDDSRVFVEDHVVGEEASVLGICDGETVVPLVAAQDHKRVFDGDKGPNTGGMGAYAPAPVMNEERIKRVYHEVLKPTVDGMKQEGVPFKGVLYAGLIVSGDDISVLEFNTRFGDPEIQAILPLMKTPLGEVIKAAVNGRLSNFSIEFHDRYAVTVVISSGGYPGHYDKGKLITGLDKVPGDITVFHAGTAFRDGRYYTAGGRVLNVTATGRTFTEARDRAYEGAALIHFEGAFYRRDIGYRAMNYFGTS
ncbi:MAG TPA: phosphoribosylamine--glycine ligase [Spirochaetes bacterium]|nr:phosphoribosylamine--glycine ligase [Spirochaetota bacterium]